mmetsp:Transcript_33254/g.84134  ORF Transcript_33254/g.84134 Transcript_33254/m.84134 type:complete len:216 (+) Transcript_33254:1400-2047(+)
MQGSLPSRTSAISTHRPHDCNRITLRIDIICAILKGVDSDLHCIVALCRAVVAGNGAIDRLRLHIPPSCKVQLGPLLFRQVEQRGKKALHDTWWVLTGVTLTRHHPRRGIVESKAAPKGFNLVGRNHLAQRVNVDLDNEDLPCRPAKRHVLPGLKFMHLSSCEMAISSCHDLCPDLWIGVLADGDRRALWHREAENRGPAVVHFGARIGDRQAKL